MIILLNSVRAGTTDPETQDINDDGVVSFGDFLIIQVNFGTKSTAVAGQYRLEGVPAGRDVAIHVMDDQWQVTAPSQGFQVVNLQPRQTLPGQNFGVRAAAVPAMVSTAQRVDPPHFG